MNHLLIGGTSYSGSTLLSLIFGGLKGAVNAGESHWLILDRSGKTPHEGGRLLSSETLEDFHHCRLCGPSCQQWTIEFRKGLQEDQTDWFYKLQKQSNASLLVSAEKEWANIQKYSQDLNFNMLISYKSPAEFVYSWKKRAWKKQSVDTILENWCQQYEDLLDAPIQGEKIIISFRDFLNFPSQVSREVCRKLSIEYSENILNYSSKPQHYVGGNFNVYERLEENQGVPLVIKPPVSYELDEEILSEVESHQRSKALHKRLELLKVKPNRSLIGRLADYFSKS